MGIKIIRLPAGHGKTAWVVDQVRRTGPGLASQPRVVLPSRLQVRDFEARLAKAGGVIGVRVGTILDLANEVLDQSGSFPLPLSEAVQIEVLAACLEGLDLDYYQAIQTKPGFVRSSHEIIRELKGGGITPGEFISAIQGSQSGPRLLELGQIYTSYQDRLREEGWADQAGLNWLAARALDKDSDLGREWGSVYLDGFDDLTPVQRQLIITLSERVEKCYLTLTGTRDQQERKLVHKRFNRLRELLPEGLVEEISLKGKQLSDLTGPGLLLEANLFAPQKETGDVNPEGIRLAAVPDREAEVRTALRWLKHKSLKGEVSLSSSAILARNLEPYRGLIYRVAHEYRVPVRLQGGLPLEENSLVAAILKLVQLAARGKEGLIWHEVLALWRSPYLNWQAITETDRAEYSRARHLADAKQLEQAASQGRVIQGYAQWEGAFQGLIRKGERSAGQERRREDSTYGEPVGERAQALWEKFQRFVDLLAPPGKEASRGSHIAWLESLLGGLDPEEPLPGGLGLVGEVLTGPEEIQERDWAALKALNGIFQDQIMAERMLSSPPVSFAQFTAELAEAISQASYQPGGFQEEAALCAGCTEARGLSFQAVALLGLAEGEFPGTIKEDPFLRDAERLLLDEEYHLPLRLSIDSAEGEYFYEAVTRSRRYLLLTRPRIAENGAAWQPSPYWEEVLRITGLAPEYRTTRSLPSPDQAGNQAEFLNHIAGQGLSLAELSAFEDRSLMDSFQKMESFSAVIQQRLIGLEMGPSIYDGDLESRRAEIAARYPADHVWSASRLETYQGCPLRYFIRYLLGLEGIELPEEGLDPRQLGNIYHHILEDLYQQVGEDYGIVDLLEKLPEAAEKVFNDAPRKEGFRETAWWSHTQQEILQKLALTLINLEAIDSSFRFYAAEQRFGIRPGGNPPLKVVLPDGESYWLHGFIDRVDRDQQGGIRIVDYKTSGKTGYTQRAVQEGKLLQLPLYALAAQEGLGLGEVREGFYFHLLTAEPSSFKLSSYRDRSSRGPEAAMERAAARGWQAVDSIRSGVFSPRLPDQGCPDYCPALDFCWQYQSRRW